MEFEYDNCRGFMIMRFDDYYGKRCSVQKSSLATNDAIWLGLEYAEPQVLATRATSVGVKTDETCGWVPYPIPDAVSLSTRMHLSRDQVKELLPVLEQFVKTGELPDGPAAKEGGR